MAKCKLDKKICSFLTVIHVLQLFIVNTLLFSVLDHVDVLASKLNNDLVKIQDWTSKISFNHDRTKKAQEVIFSKRNKKICHPNLYFDNQPIVRLVTHKHPGLITDEKLLLTNCVNDYINKASKSAGLLHK